VFLHVCAHVLTNVLIFHLLPSRAHNYITFLVHIYLHKVMSNGVFPAQADTYQFGNWINKLFKSNQNCVHLVATNTNLVFGGGHNMQIIEDVTILLKG